MSLAPVTDITPEAAPATADQDWASYLAALAYRNRVTAAGVRRMMSGFPSEAEALVAAELAALANGAA
jgi:hypothetical protein